ncbi:MAG TPA: transposase [Clostridiales bacterium]|nr:transposase [Clostridiales bacterium]
MVRGINKNDLFLEDEDKEYFLQVLADKKEQCNFLLPAYCLMDNHVHMLIKEQTIGLPDIMKRVNVSYAGYFNRKYDRVGPLFQGRYKSEDVEDEQYFLAVARYIHQNPMKAGMVSAPEAYKWSSYRDYINIERQNKLVDTESILELFSCKRGNVSKEFKNFMVQEDQRDFLDVKKKNDFLRVGKDIWIHLMPLDMPEEDKVRLLKEETNLSARELSVVTGIGRTKILYLLK